MVYDATTGFPSEIHDAQGHILKTLRDTAGRVTSVVRPDLTALGVGYDPGDNVTSVTPPGKTAHAFEYNADDQETKYTPPSNPATLASYDLDHAFQTETRADGSTVGVTRDTAGRVAAVTYGANTVTAGYNATSGHLASLTFHAMALRAVIEKYRDTMPPFPYLPGDNDDDIF